MKAIAIVSVMLSVIVQIVTLFIVSSIIIMLAGDAIKELFYSGYFGFFSVIVISLLILKKILLLGDVLSDFAHEKLRLDRSAGRFKEDTRRKLEKRPEDSV